MDFEKFEKKEYFVNRELSWLKFDERVLSEARDKNLPLFDRLKFLSITAIWMNSLWCVWRLLRIRYMQDIIKQTLQE